MSEKDQARLRVLGAIEAGQMGYREGAGMLGVSERQLRTIRARVRAQGPAVLAVLRTIFIQPTAEGARTAAQHPLAELEPRYPRVARLLRDAENDEDTSCETSGRVRRPQGDGADAAVSQTMVFATAAGRWSE